MSIIYKNIYTHVFYLFIFIYTDLRASYLKAALFKDYRDMP